MRLLGEFNVSNALAAIVAARELGVTWSDTSRWDRSGRFAFRSHGAALMKVRTFIAMVDFAHTPNALRRALSCGPDACCRQANV